MKHDTDKIGLTGKIGNLANQLRTTVKPNLNSFLMD